MAITIRAAAAALLAAAGPSMAQAPRTLSRSAYLERLHGMWLGECIANWTGLQTEGQHQNPPFLRDEDWPALGFITGQDPWYADDDTDVEYVYLHLMSQQLAQGGSIMLSPGAIAAGWLLHMNPNYIWVSNHRAWELMGRGVTPPGTGMPVSNRYWAMIDAQLTTEFFGAICPGMPEEGLQLGDVEIRTTAAGFSAHAAQFYLVLYSLATQVPAGLSGREQAVWFVREARRWISDTSKSADIVDFVLADFLSNPDVNDWERTRDRIYERYQLKAGARGFQYRAWYESSVNFACGVMCLLYGQCDYRRTVQIGTLSGWDSDNCTATMGGLLGLMLGYQGVRDAFPGQNISDRFWIARTRINLPDYLPLDPGADDTLSMMAARTLLLVDEAVRRAGGVVDLAHDRWVLPSPVTQKQVLWNPMVMEEARSANLRVRARGGTPSAQASIIGAPAWPPDEHGLGNPGYFANGYEADARGREGQEEQRYYFTSQGGGGASGAEQILTVLYPFPVEAWAVRFIEGDHAPGVGGWFESARIEVEVDGSWRAVPSTSSEPLDPGRPFQVVDFVLSRPLVVTGVRISGSAGGGFVTCAELDALAPPPLASGQRR